MRRTAVILTLAVLPALVGCAVAHRYPAYCGRVLELDTDKPIEGAGVLAVYQTVASSPGGAVHEYVGHSAVLTKEDGRFEIEPKWIFTFRVGFPFAWFEYHPRFTIYKHGYGNFPGSFGGGLAKQGKSDRALPMFHLPAGEDVIFWLPKLHGRDEEYQHRSWMPHVLPLGQNAIDFHPEGTDPSLFGY